MTIAEIIAEKNAKAKDKTIALSSGLLNGEFSMQQVLETAQQLKDAAKAILIEALEYATKERPQLMQAAVFDFLIECLQSKSPRVKMESARTIANCAALFPAHTEAAYYSLIKNAGDEGTVLRWSVATAMNELSKTKTWKTAWNQTIRQLHDSEEKNSIRKIYAAVLKKA
ncbi:MAG: hypothetical protein U0T73_08420 [Chitinophagales bacterium]